MDPDRLHMMKVSGLGADGSTLWESSIVALSPPPAPARGGARWMLVLGVILVGLVVWRWRAQRHSA
ncbi:MAG: hypothetical protein ABI540_05265 [Spartobacteria bacterium]